MFDITRYWYRENLHPLTLTLLPFSWAFHLGVIVRRWFYRIGIKKSHQFSVPVIVVGNITVGGTGKTPFVIWLAKWLQTQGYRPGIVSRGVGGKKRTKPHFLSAGDQASEVGDEAILIMQQSECPMVIGANRAAAVRHLLNNSDCNIVISDDGLQHYRMHRDIEVVMIDSVRKFGNKRLLPAGPLRESVTRLKHADVVIMNGETDFTICPEQLVSLKNPHLNSKIETFPHKVVHAVAGIGNPDRFFNQLRELGFTVIEHAFPDHHFYEPHELLFADAYPIIMTEKDAVKCTAFANERCWYLRITVKINNSIKQKLLENLKKLIA